jgi:GNAT superfamily N-acetyltransferase
MPILTCPSSPTHTSHHVLRDGSEIVLRPLERGATKAVSEVFDGLGPKSRYQRFLVPKVALTASDLRQLSAVDHRDHAGVAAFSAVDGAAIGIGRFIRLRGAPDTAELAVTVIDAWHRLGVGGILAEALAARAQSLHVRMFSIYISRENQAASQLVRGLSGDLECVSRDSQAAEFLLTLRPVPTAGL